MKHEPKHTPGPFTQADAALIASAPDLLDMLNAAVLHLERINYLASRPDINGYPNSEFVTPESEMAKFHAAIKKAEGGNP